MKTLFAIGSAALLFSGTAAIAQSEMPGPGVTDGAVADAGLPPIDGGDTAASPQTAPTAPAPITDASEAGASFTDSEIDSYVTAAMEVQELQSDPALNDAAQQERAGTILAEAGLDPQTFNAISDAIQSDPEVAERVQLALANRRGSPGA